MANSIEFLRPHWLWAGLVILPWLVYAKRTSLVAFPQRQQVWMLAMRTLILGMILLSVAGLAVHRTVDRRFVVLAVDRSESIDASHRQQIERTIEQFRHQAGTHRVAVMEFAGRPGPLQLLDGSPLAVSERPSDSLERRETDIATAIEVARAAIPSDYTPHVVLVSDGHPTGGDPLLTASRGSVPVSTIALPDTQSPEVQVVDVRGPEHAKVGEPFDVEVVLSTNRPGPVEIELFRDDFRIELGDSATFDCPAGEHTVRLRQELTEPKSVIFTARVIADRDSRLDDNQRSAFVVVSGWPRVLLVDSDPDSLDALRWVLEQRDMSVELVPPSGLPTSLSEWVAFDAVVLSDVPATAMSTEQQVALREYVEELGGGLLMLGGPQSFGLGGYAMTPLEPLLPVRSDLDRERDKPSLAMVLVIDRSGSMGGLKLDLAKEAARASVDLLGLRDQIGIVAFDDEAYWVHPLSSATDGPSLVDNIRRLSAAGGTNLYPALNESLAKLRSAVAKIKHVIVLSDGISAPADFASLISDFVSERIVVSTVAVGDKADRELLKEIARQGGGRYYECTDPRAVPQVFAQETMMAGKSAIDEDPFLAIQIRATSALRGIDITTAPLLLGHVVTEPKGTSEVILVSENGDPLLAWWRFGLGMSLAFTSDAKARWAVEWLTWPEFSSFWVQCVRHVMRTTHGQGGQLLVHRADRQIHVALDLSDADESFVNKADSQLTVISPNSDEPEEFSMRQVAPGRYETKFAAGALGPYLMGVTSRLGNQIVFQQTTGTFVGYPDELRLRPTNRTLMSEIARQSGGYVNPDAEQVFAAPARGGFRTVPLWRGLITLAMLLWVLDVALRRIRWA